MKAIRGRLLGLIKRENNTAPSSINPIAIVGLLNLIFAIRKPILSQKRNRTVNPL